MIEAVTDPFPDSQPGYGQVDEGHLYWAFVIGGGELGDLCAQDRDAFTKFPGLDYVFQRSWSKGQCGAGVFAIVSKLNGKQHYWFGLVGEQ